jgi:hypothetical protein
MIIKFIGSTAAAVAAIVVLAIVAIQWQNRVTESKLDAIFADKQQAETFERLLAKQRAENEVRETNREANRRQEIEERQKNLQNEAKAFSRMLGGTP